MRYMLAQPFKIQLYPKIDRDNQTMYIGKVNCPLILNFSKGLAFFVYLSKEINEIHITNDSSQFHDVFRYYKEGRKRAIRNRNGNLTVDLEARYERLKENEEGPAKIFYIGKCKCDATLTLDEETVFLVFVSDKGEEELQISRQEKKYKRPEVDKLYLRS